MCGDRRAYSGDKMPIGSKSKVHRLEDGSLLGISTTTVGGDTQLRDWVERGCPLPTSDSMQPESFELLLVRPGGEVFYANNAPTLTGPLTGEYWAAGSGSHFALGAMCMGADARRAVEVASELDVWSGNGLDSLSLNGTLDTTVTP